ncbi:hypothetical protein MLGJGCBP_01517 [Rhodococcus sp. T7]|nr:hypothetical protein MLGJGCBP_01517 [Rhodococcus sp. T7]
MLLARSNAFVPMCVTWLMSTLGLMIESASAASDRPSAGVAAKGET